MTQGTPPPSDPSGEHPPYGQQPYGHQPYGQQPPAQPTYGQPPYAHHQGGGFQPPATHGSATTAFVLGICGLVLCQVLGIPAYVIGRRAEREIRASGGTLGGEGLAKAGWIMGVIAMVIMGLAVLLLVVLFVFGAAMSTSGA